MATTVKIRRSGTATATPSSLEHGELAINYADKTLYFKDSTDAIQSFVFQSYALASHTHAASDITSGTLDSARLPLATTGAAGAVIVGTGLGVSSGTVSVTYGTTSGTACEGNDARLSDTRTPTDNTVSTAKIQDAAVTYAKLQNVSTTDRLLGRSTAGAGVVEEITCTAFGRSLIDDTDAAAARTTLGVQPTASPAFTGAASFGNTIAVGATLSSWASNAGVVQTANYASLSAFNDPSLHLTLNAYYDGANWVYISSAAASNYYQLGGEHVWRGAASGTAGTNVSWTTRLTISSTGTATFTGQVLADDIATANSVAYGFDSDPNTGVGRAGADILTLVTGGSERVRVDASGNVGIGLTPLQKFHVGRSGSGIAARFTDNATQTLDLGITASAGVYYDNPNSGYHEWQIGGSGKMRLTGGGEVLIGTTTDNGAYLLQVNSQIYATNATIATSDARFKTRVESLTDATSVIEALRPVAFDFIPQEDRNFATERQVGLIAQETQEALAGTDYADSVVAQCGDHLGLAYEKLVPVLIKALQESNARIAALEERLDHA